MSRRSKIIIAVIVILLLLFGLLWFFFRPKVQVLTDEQATEALANQTAGGLLNTTTGSNVNRGTNVPVVNTNSEPVPPPPPDERTNLRRLAASFAERFGSFSNQGDYANVLELKTFMTAKMSNWADGYVADQRAKQQANAAYFGVTTRAINTNLKAFDDAKGTATVIVTTQRSEEKSLAAEARVYYQDISMEFVKDGNVWKVDSASWK